MSAEVLSLDRRHERASNLWLMLAALAATALTLWMLWTLSERQEPLWPETRAIWVFSGREAAIGE